MIYLIQWTAGWMVLALHAWCIGACSVVSDSSQPQGVYPSKLLCPWNSPGKNAEVGCHFLLQEIFLTQGWNPRRLHWQPYSLLLCHWGSPGLFRY